MGYLSVTVIFLDSKNDDLLNTLLIDTFGAGHH